MKPKDPLETKKMKTSRTVPKKNWKGAFYLARFLLRLKRKMKGGPFALT